jgi:hypothetical protein
VVIAPKWFARNVIPTHGWPTENRIPILGRRKLLRKKADGNVLGNLEFFQRKNDFNGNPVRQDLIDIESKE